MSNSSYHYDQLPENSIRLLMVTGIGSDGMIECTLHIQELTDSLGYYALSYAWGSTLANRRVRCNGSALAVTQSVHEALIALLNTLVKDELPVWIDMVCINQQDTREKEREVQRMDRIFSSAKVVLVWLGPEAQDSALAMRHLQSVATVLSTIKYPPDWSGLELLGLPHQNDPVWPAIGHLYRRKWFKRLWVFQEAVLAQTIMVFCGKERVDWETFSKVGSKMNRAGLVRLAVSGKHIMTTDDGFIFVSYVSQAKMAKKMVGDRLAKTTGKLDPDSPEGVIYSKQAGHITMSQLLSVSRDKLCHEPRDKVYGMLSLTSKEFRSKITVSYSKTRRQLNIDTGKACLELDGYLDYLRFVAGRSKFPELPTWCSDLSGTTCERDPFGDYLNAGFCGGADNTLRATVKTFPDKEYIEICGFRAERIDKIVPPGDFPRAGSEICQLVGMSDWHQKCVSLSDSIANVRPNIDIMMAHAYAVTGNTISRVPDGEALKLVFEDIMLHVASRANISTPIETYWPPKERIPLFADTSDQLFNTAGGRSFFTTIAGRLGVGPQDVRRGDIVIVAYGARPVFVLREQEDSNTFEFIGDAFVHELMELDRTPGDAIGPEETFRIV